MGRKKRNSRRTPCLTWLRSKNWPRLANTTQVEYFSNVKPDLFADVINKFMAHGKSMDMTQPEGEHSAHEGMEGMDMSHAESAH